jgi:hypothetical protein
MPADGMLLPYSPKNGISARPIGSSHVNLRHFSVHWEGVELGATMTFLLRCMSLFMAPDPPFAATRHGARNGGKPDGQRCGRRRLARPIEADALI